MESDSISIVAKDDVTLEIARNVAKQSKTLANLIASTDETRHKEPIRLPQFDASTLDKVFGWCEVHSEADPAHADFSMSATFTNEYPRVSLTPWETDFFDHCDALKWKLAVSASYLDVPYLYFSTCFVISESLRIRRQEWDAAVSESVSDDVLCDVLRFFSQKDIAAGDPQEARWKRVIEKNARVIPLKIVRRADIEGDEIHVSKKKVLDDLHSLSCYAVEKLSIDRFGKKECAVTQAFLNDPYTRLRVKCLDVGEIPRKSRKALRTRLRTLQQLSERLNFLEEVQLDLSSDMQAESLTGEPGLLAFPSCVKKLTLSVWLDVDTEAIVAFIEVLYAAWNRPLAIDFVDDLIDPLPILSKVYEKFVSDVEPAPLLITATVPRHGYDRDTDRQEKAGDLQQFVEDRGFIQVTSGDIYDYDVYFEYEKERGKDWKLTVDYNDESLSIEIKRVSE